MDENEELNLPVMAFQHVLAMIGAVVVAAVVLPTWLPALTDSLTGDEPSAYWYISRASAMVAYLLAWLSMLIGVAMTNKLARIWPGGPIAFDLHQHTGLLSIVFALLHALILLGDKYIAYTLPQVLVPFQSSNFSPFWVGMGQVGLYLMMLVGLTFYIRKRLTQKVWRWIHYLSFVMFVMVFLHGINAGTDSTSPWAKSIYAVTGVSLLFFCAYRVLMKVPVFVEEKPRRQPIAAGEVVVKPIPKAKVAEGETAAG